MKRKNEVEDKQIKPDSDKSEKNHCEKFFFPDYNLTIEASNMAEAQEKLKQIINKTL